MKKLRLLFTRVCPRTCPGCCNKDWNLSNLPSFVENEESLKDFKEVLITGGEPLLFPSVLYAQCMNIRRLAPHIKIFIYTAFTRSWDSRRLKLLEIVDGFTITIHDQEAANEFNETRKQLRSASHNYKGLSMRLNIFDGCKLYYPKNYVIKDKMVWIENCPLPKDEVFMKISTL